MSQTKPTPEYEEIRERCLGLLARREHSRRELLRKLKQRGFDCTAVADVVLDDLEEQGLLSEVRFAESFVRARIESGHGPLKIRAGLQERGVASTTVNQALCDDRSTWRARCRETWEKRFGVPPEDRSEFARQTRFLASRGFDSEDIRAVLQEVGTADENNEQSE
ncbi:MAG: regulatory protein RecX [Gammaproteobacteria bacterium]|nr:regulatory protein RecX [Gammaproteobacteria bacterium]